MSLRCAVILLVLAVCGLSPAAAHAGTYEVAACDAGVAGGANNSFALVADAGMTAHNWCPAGQGIVARNVWDNGQTGGWQGAYLIFDAPTGSHVESVSFMGAWERHNCAYSVDVVASGHDLSGRHVIGLQGYSDCASGFQEPDDFSFFGWRFDLPINAPRVRFESRCIGPSTCPRNGIASIRIKDVRVRVRDDQAPALSNGRGALWVDTSRWYGGSQTVGFDASDGPGIREASIRIDGREIARGTNGCDFTLRAPCSQRSMAESFNTSGWGDGAHQLSFHAVDAAGNEAVAARTVRIDNTPPDPPKDLVLAGGEGWRSTNDFDLTWRKPSSGGAPVVAAEYELCPVAPGAKCTRGGVPGHNLDAIKDFKVPEPGEYRLKVWLRDEAGNHDPRLAAPTVMLRYDDASPQLKFQPLSAEDPTAVVVATSDKGSGVASGQVAMRRKGQSNWFPLKTIVDGANVVGRIDDEHLGDGIFELQARVTDHAGNERSTNLRGDGSPAEVTLPLRLKTVMRAGLVRRRGGRARLARTARVRYGQLVRVRGRLRSPERNPIPNAPIQVFTQPSDSTTPPRLIATLVTSKTGRFSFLLRRGPSRSVRIRYEGTNHIRSITRRLRLDVRARTTMRPSRRRAVTGEYVRFRGRVRSGPIPDRGKLVELQVWVRGRWRTFATTRAGRAGRWSYRYRFDGTRGRQTYRFRAQIPPEAGYPFVTGRSRVVRVSVNGV